jgi:hypothetical protein
VTRRQSRDRFRHVVASSRADAAAIPVSDSQQRWSSAIGALLTLAMFLACCMPLSDTDLFWHLKTGEWILDTGQIPVLDPYTFTNAERPWIDLHWGFQVFMAAVYRLGGSALLVTVKAAILAAVVGVGWLATGRDLPAWLRAVPWMLALITISGRGYERPEMFSLLFLAAWLWVMERSDERPQWLWWLPALQVLWVNMHALFVLGLVVGGCRTVDEVFRRACGGQAGLSPSAGAISPRQGTYVAVLCALASLVNPYFEEGALFPLVLYRKFNVEQAFYSRNIGEFQQPIAMFPALGFRSIYFNAEMLLWCVAAFSFVLLAVSSRRWSVYRLLLFIAFSHLAWEAVRNTSIFSLVAAAVTCGNLNDWWSGLPEVRRDGVWMRRANWIPGLLLPVFIALIVTGDWHRVAGEYKSFGFGERVGWFPHAAARFAGQREFPDRAFAAHFGVASVYSYHNGPARKIFMDGRLEVCSQKTFMWYNDILRLMAAGNPRWEYGLRDERGRMPVVLLDCMENPSRAAITGMSAQPRWRLVYADSSCAVFLETAEAERLGLPLADFTPLIEPPGLKVRKR